MVDDDIDGIFPIDGFFSDSFPGGGVENHERICLPWELIRKFLDKLLARQEPIHWNHPSFDVEARILAAFAESVG